MVDTLPSGETTICFDDTWSKIINKMMIMIIASQVTVLTLSIRNLISELLNYKQA